MFTWLIPLVLLVLAWFKAHTDWRLFGVGVGMLVLGEIMRFWAAGTIHKDNSVATSGPYAYVRNPLYFGSLLLAFGYGLMSGLGWIATVACVVLFSIFHLAAIAHEEAFLKTKFGEPYLEYLKHVPRLLPKPIPYRDGTGEAATFSWEQVVFNREPTTALVTAVTAAIFALVQVFHPYH